MKKTSSPSIPTSLRKDHCLGKFSPLVNSENDMIEFNCVQHLISLSSSLLPVKLTAANIGEIKATGSEERALTRALEELIKVIIQIGLTEKQNYAITKEGAKYLKESSRKETQADKDRESENDNKWAHGKVGKKVQRKRGKTLVEEEDEIDPTELMEYSESESADDYVSSSIKKKKSKQMDQQLALTAKASDFEESMSCLGNALKYSISAEGLQESARITAEATERAKWKIRSERTSLISTAGEGSVYSSTTSLSSNQNRCIRDDCSAILVCGAKFCHECGTTQNMTLV